jgi:hypothetical protein
MSNSIAARMLVARFYDQHEISTLQTEVKELVIEIVRFFYHFGLTYRTESPLHNASAAALVAKWAPEINFLTSFAFYGSSLYLSCSSSNISDIAPSTIGQSLSSLFMFISPSKTITTTNRRKELLLTLSSVCLFYSGLSYLKERSEDILNTSKEVFSILIADERITSRSQYLLTAPESLPSFFGIQPDPLPSMSVKSEVSVWAVIFRALQTSLPSLGGPTNGQWLQSMFALIHDGHLLQFLRHHR